MDVTMLVTLSAIVEYLQKAREAQEKLDEATEQMNRAAQNLCNQWQGAAAMAFAEEQQVLYNHCKGLGAVGSEYIATLTEAKRKYEEMEERVKAAITAK